MEQDDEVALLLLDKERADKQWDALVTELKEQGYKDKEICRILRRR